MICKIFVGYLKASNGYILYNALTRLIKSRDVKFLQEFDNNFEKSFGDQSGNEPTEFVDDDLMYDDKFIDNKLIIDQFDNKPTNEKVNHERYEEKIRNESNNKQIDMNTSSSQTVWS